MREYKLFSDLEAREAGQFTARVAVTRNVDRYGDRILPGAFAASLAAWAANPRRRIPVVYAHAWRNPDALLGHVLEAKEDGQGLVVEAQLDLEQESAMNVFRKMKTGALAEFSFGFETKRFHWVAEGRDKVRELEAVDLFEVGPCLLGANPETELLGVKTGRLGLVTAGPLAEALLEVLTDGAPLTLADRKALTALAPRLQAAAAPAPADPAPLDPSWVGRLETLLAR